MIIPLDQLAALHTGTPGAIENEYRNDWEPEKTAATGEKGHKLRTLGASMPIECPIDPATSGDLSREPLKGRYMLIPSIDAHSVTTSLS